MISKNPVGGWRIMSIKFTIMWIPSHVGVTSNERADHLVGDTEKMGYSGLHLVELLIFFHC
jgi:hypothetical protein